MPLTPRQKRFAQEYLIDLNASAAYRRAGGKAKGHSAEQQASVLMRNGEVKAEVERLIAAREKRTQITADRVLRELALLAFSSIDDYELDDDGRIVLRPGVEPDAMRAVRRTRFRKRPVVAIPPRRRRGAAANHESPVAQVEIETDICLWDKLAALKMCMEHVGLGQPPTIDAFLDLMPRDLAVQVRQFMASPPRPESTPAGRLTG